MVPQRGDEVEAFIKTARDSYHYSTFGDEFVKEWTALDQLLDKYRLHADTGTPLDQPVSEGGSD